MNNILETILENYTDQEFLIADGFNDAVIGLEESSGRLIYSTIECVRILQKVDGLSEEDAIEYFYYNVQGSYVGEKTPIWCNDLF